MTSNSPLQRVSIQRNHIVSPHFIPEHSSQRKYILAFGVMCPASLLSPFLCRSKVLFTPSGLLTSFGFFQTFSSALTTRLLLFLSDGLRPVKSRGSLEPGGPRRENPTFLLHSLVAAGNHLCLDPGCFSSSIFIQHSPFAPFTRPNPTSTICFRPHVSRKKSAPTLRSWSSCWRFTAPSPTPFPWSSLPSNPASGHL